MKIFPDLCLRQAAGPITLGPVIAAADEVTLHIDVASYHWTTSNTFVVSFDDGQPPLDSGSGTTSMKLNGLGTAVVTVTAKDVYGLVGSRSFTINVVDATGGPQVSVYNVITNSPFEMIPTITAPSNCGIKSITWRRAKNAAGEIAVRLPDDPTLNSTFGFSNQRVNGAFAPYFDPLVISFNSPLNNLTAIELTKASMAMAWSNDTLPPNGIFDCEIEVKDFAGRVAVAPFSVRIDTENRSYGINVSGGSYGTGKESELSILEQGPSHYFNLFNFIFGDYGYRSEDQPYYPLYLSEYADEGTSSLVEPFKDTPTRNYQTSCRQCVRLGDADWRRDYFPLNATCSKCPTTESGVYMVSLHAWNFEDRLSYADSPFHLGSCETIPLMGDAVNVESWLAMPKYGDPLQVPISRDYNNTAAIHPLPPDTQDYAEPSTYVFEWITADLAGNIILNGSHAPNFNTNSAEFNDPNSRFPFGCQEPHVVRFDTRSKPESEE